MAKSPLALRRQRGAPYCIVAPKAVIHQATSSSDYEPVGNGGADPISHRRQSVGVFSVTIFERHTLRNLGFGSCMVCVFYVFFGLLNQATPNKKKSRLICLSQCARTRGGSEFRLCTCPQPQVGARARSHLSGSLWILSQTRWLRMRHMVCALVGSAGGSRSLCPSGVH